MPHLQLHEGFTHCKALPQTKSLFGRLSTWAKRLRALAADWVQTAASTRATLRAGKEDIQRSACRAIDGQWKWMTGKCRKWMTGKCHKWMTGKCPKWMTGKCRKWMTGKCHKWMTGKCHKWMTGKCLGLTATYYPPRGFVFKVCIGTATRPHLHVTA